MARNIAKILGLTLIVGAGLCWIFFWPLLGLVQDRMVASAEVVTTDLGPSLYRLDVVLDERPVGGAILASIGKDGVLLVDGTGSEVLVDKIMTALEDLGATGVDRVVTTHAHPDHFGGNTSWARSGAILTSHLRTDYWMSVELRPFAFAPAVPPVPDRARPVEKIEREESLRFNGQEIRLLPVGPAHTDGDLVVHFVDAGVAHVGDLFHGLGRYSTAAWINGGKVDGLAAELRRLSTELPQDTRLVGGHSAIGSTSGMPEMARYQEVQEWMVNEVREALLAGQKTEEIIPALAPTAAEWMEKGGVISRRSSPEGWVGNIAGSLQRSPDLETKLSQLDRP